MILSVKLEDVLICACWKVFDASEQKGDNWIKKQRGHVFVVSKNEKMLIGEAGIELKWSWVSSKCIRIIKKNKNWKYKLSLPSGGLLRYDYNRLWDESLHFIVCHFEYECKPGNSGRQEAVEEEKGKAITANGQKESAIWEKREDKDRGDDRNSRASFPSLWERVL